MVRPETIVKYFFVRPGESTNSPRSLDNSIIAKKPVLAFQNCFKALYGQVPKQLLAIYAKNTKADVIPSNGSDS